MEKKKDGQNGWQKFWQRAKPVFRKIGAGLRVAADYVVRQRKILLAIPVVVTALLEARKNWQVLPDQVGISLLNPSVFAQTISKSLAVFSPLIVTAVCLWLMFCSRRTLFPWLISVFSLALPWLFYLTNVLLA